MQVYSDVIVNIDEGSPFVHPTPDRQKCSFPFVLFGSMTAMTMSASTTEAKEEEDDHRWYFAIGSMMNPHSLKRRGLVPTESHPAILLDFRLYFFGTLGIAEAIPQEGDHFHGVIHRLNKDAIEALDKIERDYVQLAAKAKLYDGTIHEVFCYGRTGEVARNKEIDFPPGERYIQIMVDGCRHFGVDQVHIDYLLNHEQRPRPSPDEFKCVGEIPEDGPLYSMQQVQDMYNEGRAVLTFQGKVLEFFCEEGKIVKEMRGFVADFSIHGELQVSQLAYDPKYGNAASLADCTREFAGYFEDIFTTYMETTGLRHNWKVIGKFADQVYKDDC